MPAPTRHRDCRVRDLFPSIVFLSFTERGGEVGMRFAVKMAPRNTIQGAKTPAIARPVARRPTSPGFRNPAKTRGLTDSRSEPFFRPFGLATGPMPVANWCLTIDMLAVMCFFLSSGAKHPANGTMTLRPRGAFGPRGGNP